MQVLKGFALRFLLRGTDLFSGKVARTRRGPDVGIHGVGKNGRVPPIPDAHLATFNRMLLRARQLFGDAVTEKLIAPDTHRLPSFRVGDLSVIGEQWLVVAISPGSYPYVYARRWEFDWDSNLDEAIVLLESYQQRFLLAPSPGIFSRPDLSRWWAAMVR